MGHNMGIFLQALVAGFQFLEQIFLLEFQILLIRDIQVYPDGTNNPSQIVITRGGCSPAKTALPLLLFLP